MKKYKLLKDLPDAKKGEIYILRNPNGDTYVNEYTLNQKSPVIEHNSYFAWQVENNPEWFELVTPPSIVPERIEVKVLPYGGNGMMAFVTNSTKFPKEKLPEIEKAILSVLNDTVEDKRTLKISETLGSINPFKKYTQSEVDAMMEKVFGDGYFKGWYNGCFDEDKTMSRKVQEAAYKDYIKTNKATLPLQQVQEDKPVQDELKTGIMSQMDMYHMGYKDGLRYGSTADYNKKGLFVTDDARKLSNGDAITLTKEQLDTMMENVWNAARLTHPLAGMKFDTFKDYQNNLPENQPPMSKEEVNTWLNSTGSDTPQSPTNLKEGDFITGDFPYQPQPSTTVKDKQDFKEWKIVDIMDDSGQIISNPSTDVIWACIEHNGERIHSVRRESDKEIFSIGDKITWGCTGIYETTLTGFVIKDGRLKFNDEKANGRMCDFLNAIDLRKLPTPNTDTINQSTNH